MMLISITCQVFLDDHIHTNKFSLFKAGMISFSRRFVVKKKRISYTQANETCQGKLGRVYGV